MREAPKLLAAIAGKPQAIPSTGAGAPAARLAHQVPVPVLSTVDFERPEALELDSIRNLHQAGAVAPQQRHGPTNRSGGNHKRSTARRPGAHALGPALREAPPRRRSGLDSLQHQELGAVELTDDGDPRRQPARRFVDWGQVVQVEDLG